MTVQEFISRYDADHENTATNEQKIRWLKRIELTVMSDVMRQYNDHDKPGMRREVILYDGDISRRIDGNVLDLSDENDLYVDDDELIITSFDVDGGGRREADDLDVDTHLIVPEPYDNVYEYYIDQRIAQLTGDIPKYNRAAALFDQAYAAFRKYYARVNYPNSHRTHLLRHEAL